MTLNLHFFATSASKIAWEDAAIENLRTALLGVPYLLGAVGIALAAFNAKANPEELLKAVFLGLIIVVLVTGYREALKGITESFWEMRESVNKQNEIKGLLNAEFDDPPSKWDIADYIAYTAAYCFQFIGKGGIKVIEWLQGLALAGLYVISPIGLGMIALPWTRQIGINFIMTSIGVALWALGVAVVDVLLAKLSTEILAVCGLTGAVSLGAAGAAAAGVISVGPYGWALIAAGLLLSAIIVNAMYLSVPFVVAAIMRGGNPFTSAAAAGIKGVAIAAGLGMAAKQLSGGGGSGGGSSGTGSGDDGGTRKNNQGNSNPVEPADAPKVESGSDRGGVKSSQSYSSGGNSQTSTPASGSSSTSTSGGTPANATSGGGSSGGTSSGTGGDGSSTGGQTDAAPVARPLKSARQIASDNAALEIKKTIDDLRSHRR